VRSCGPMGCVSVVFVMGTSSVGSPAETLQSTLSDRDHGRKRTAGVHAQS
jgi:hypothetical protein